MWKLRNTSVNFAGVERALYGSALCSCMYILCDPRSGSYLVYCVRYLPNVSRWECSVNGSYFMILTTVEIWKHKEIILIHIFVYTSLQIGSTDPRLYLLCRNSNTIKFVFFNKKGIFLQFAIWTKISHMYFFVVPLM